MSKREKIILVFMAIALAYGAFALLTARKPRKTRSRKRTVTVSAPSSSRLGATADTYRQDVKKNVLSALDGYALDRSGNAWRGSPFVDSFHRFGDDRVPEGEAFQYSGRLAMAGDTLAIINGAEYRVGDALVEADYTVECIDAEKVVLRHKRTDRKVTVFAEEETQR